MTPSRKDACINWGLPTLDEQYAKAISEALLSCDMVREKILRASKRTAKREASLHTMQDICDNLYDCRVKLDDMDRNQEVMDK